jgi:hypothetical protein
MANSRGSAPSPNQAIYNTSTPTSAACAKEELAPLALDAYPEAYPEFKRLLLLLIYQGASGQQQGSAAAALAQEWDPASRAELAGQIYHTACQAQGEQGRMLHCRATGTTLLVLQARSVPTLLAITLCGRRSAQAGG